MKIFRLEISKYTYWDFLEEIKEFLTHSPIQISHKEGKSERQRWRAIFTPNPEICLKTLKDDEFLKVLQSAEYLTSDGIGLYIGYQINDSHLPRLFQFFMLPVYIFNILFRKKSLYKKYGDRICGSDVTNSLLKYCQENNIKIAIIDPSYPLDRVKCRAQESFREKLSQKFQKLDFDFYIYSQENCDKIFQKIDDSQAQILFSTLGMKRQEISVLRWLELCPHLKLWLWIGWSFDYHIWFQKRAPKILRDVGFEWLYRIFTSPNKLQRLVRIYQALIVFPLQVIAYKK